jgi:hypothetical protein
LKEGSGGVADDAASRARCAFNQQINNHQSTTIR